MPENPGESDPDGWAPGWSSAGLDSAGTGSAGPASADPRVRLAVIEHESGTDARRFGHWLTEAGAELRVFRPYARGSEDQLPLPGEFDGLVVLGGSMGPADDAGHPWLPGTRELLRTSVGGQFPALAICLGGELLAQATGGQIEQRATAQIGLSTVRTRSEASADPVFSGLPERFPAYLWHSLQVTLPPNAVHLVDGTGAPVQAFRLGEAWGTQFHPESTGEQLGDWGAASGITHAPDGRTLDDVVLAVTAAEPQVAAVMAPLAHRFVAYVRQFAASTAGPR